MRAVDVFCSFATGSQSESSYFAVILDVRRPTPENVFGAERRLAVRESVPLDLPRLRDVLDALDEQ